jgi:lysophospholipase L1-like esterase
MPAAAAQGGRSRTVDVVGDSITFITGWAIGKEFVHYTVDVDGVPGSVMAGQLPAVERFAATDPWAMVIELGTNDAYFNVPGWQAAFQNEEDAVAGQRCVIFLTLPAKFGPEALGIDNAISTAVATNADFHELNWGVLGYKHPSWLWADGIHPDTHGQQELAKDELDAVRTYCR